MTTEQRMMSKKTGGILLSIIGWLILIFLLSSQNGPETANTSLGMAENIAKLLYQQPTIQEINEVHMMIRQIAHVVLFFVLGILVGEACSYMGIKSRRYLYYVAGYAFILLCSFFDEWHKQFIIGRHNQFEDAMLNVLGGTIGIVLIIIISYFRRIKKNC